MTTAQPQRTADQQASADQRTAEAAERDDAIRALTDEQIFAIAADELGFEMDDFMPVNARDIHRFARAIEAHLQKVPQ